MSYIDKTLRFTYLSATGGMTLVQKRRTMHQDWNTFFDSHLYDGRVIHMLIMDRVTNDVIADISIGVHILAGYCKETGEQPNNVQVYDMLLAVNYLLSLCFRKTVMTGTSK
jgi:hypothetical protein